MEVRECPLGHLGHALSREVCSSDGSFTSDCGDGDLAAIASLSDDRAAESSLFSIHRWRARIAQRAIDQKLATDLHEAEAKASCDDECSGAIHSIDSSGVCEAELLQWLIGHFEMRDAGRTDRTVAALKSLAQAGEVKRLEDMISLARDGILTLSREGWRMLQERHPAAVPSHVAPPGNTSCPANEYHPSRPSRCPVYLVPPRRNSQPKQGYEDSCVSEPPGSHRTGSSGADQETLSAVDSPYAPSSESSVAWSESALTTNTSLSMEDDIAPRYDDARYTYAHRDDWELQYMVNGVFDEIFICLDSGQTHDTGEAIHRVRLRVLEWTLRRWLSCRGCS